MIKRKVSAFLTLIFTMAIIAAGQTTIQASNYIMNETFDSVAGWNITKQAGDSINIVDASIFGTTGSCVEMNRVSTSNNFRIERPLPSAQSQTVVLSTRVCSPTDNTKLTFYADSPTSSPIAQMYIDTVTNKRIRYNSGATSVDFVPPLITETGKVYNLAIKISFDASGTPSAQYYCNGVKLMTQPGKTVRDDTIKQVGRVRFEIGTTVTKAYIDNVAVYYPASASDLYISGIPQVDDTLTANYTFVSNDDSDEGASQYRWFMSDNLDGPYTVISGATGKTFVPGADCIGKYIKFEVTPVDSNGIDGMPVLSAPTAEPVKDAPSVKPVATDVSITGEAVAGGTLRGEYTYSSPQNISEGVSIYRWLYSDTAGGPLLPISGATGRTYTVSSAYKGKYIYFEVTPVDSNGQKGMAKMSDGVQIEPGLPVDDSFDDDTSLSGWTLTGGAYGQVAVEAAPSGGTGGAMKLTRTSTASGTCSISKTISPLSGTVIVKAKIYPANSNAKATFYADGGSALSPVSQMYFDTTNIKYADGTGSLDFSPPVTYEAGKWYELEMVINTNDGVNSTAKYFINGVEAAIPGGKQTVRTSQTDIRRIRFDLGAVLNTIYIDYVKVYQPKAPSAQNVSIIGQPVLGGTLIGSYTFVRGENNPEGNSVYRWLSSYTANGTYTQIDGVNSDTLIITNDLVGQYIKFEVTPVDQLGIPGPAALSQAVRVPAAGMKVLNVFDPQTLTANSWLSCNVTLINYDQFSKNSVVILALFDANNTMKAVKRVKVPIDADSVASTQLNVHLPSVIDGYSAQVFVWDKSSTMVPYCDTFKIP